MKVMQFTQKEKELVRWALRLGNKRLGQYIVIKGGKEPERKRQMLWNALKTCKDLLKRME